MMKLPWCIVVLVAWLESISGDFESTWFDEWDDDYRLSADLYGETGSFSHLFTEDEYASMTTKRIRREIRDLSDDQWDRIVDAMNIMKNMSESDGRAMYGDYYQNYDVLVCQHAIGTYGPSGDLGHLGPVFNIWHRAYILSFENSLIAIDPDIEGLPYWDFRRDQIELNDTVDLSESIIFSDDYFGDFYNDDAVTNGRFGHWMVHDNPSEVGCDSQYQNAFGLLRAKENAEGNPFVTRYGGSLCDGNTFSVGDMDIYDQCMNTTDYTELFFCYNFNVHARAHIAVGGSRRSWENQTVDEWPLCTFWHASSWTLVDGIRTWGMNHDCFECPEANSCIFDADDPFSNFNCAACNLSASISNTSICVIEGTEKLILGERLGQHTHGDFLDQSTASNDPLFMFHHCNLDRYLMEWQLRNYDDAPYYGYPESGYSNLLRLNDTVAPDAPFEHLFYGEMNETLGEGPYSTRDIWDGTTFMDSPYVYDSVLNLVANGTTTSTESAEGESEATDNDDEGMSDAVTVIGYVVGSILIVGGVYCMCRGGLKIGRHRDPFPKLSECSPQATATQIAVNSTASTGTTAGGGETAVEMS